MASGTCRGDQDKRGGVDWLAEDEAGRMLSSLELLDFETDRSQTIPLRGHPELTLRDEANAIAAHVFRNGFLEILHSGLPSPLVTNPRFTLSGVAARCVRSPFEASISWPAHHRCQANLSLCECWLKPRIICR
jgi:hypothetical protein